jgi:hypothetical protein
MPRARTPFTRAALAAGVLALVASLSACGSTVPIADQVASGDGLSQVPTSQGSGTDTNAGPSATLGPSGSLGGVSPQAQPSRAASTAAALATAVAGQKTGPVQVGFLVTKCGNCDLLGSGYNAPTHSEQTILEALVRDQNSRGGFLGHKIVPVFGVEDTAANDVQTMMQSICSTFTQDHHVIAVLGAGFSFQEILAKCLAKAGIVTIDATRSTGVPDDVDLAKYPGWVLANEPSANGYALSALTSAVADGWVTTKSKLGFLNFSCPETDRAWKNTILPYLAANHLTPTVVSTLSCPSGAGDLGAAAQGVAAAELKMHANGVDTVVTTDIPLIVFAEAAESQGWRPKYVATEGAAAYQTLLATAQQRNIHSAGWEPTYDLDARHQLPLSTSAKSCLAALKRGGMGNPSVSEHVLYFGLCGGFQLYLQGVTKAQSLAPSLVLDAIEVLGSTFLSPMVLGERTLLSATQHTAPVSYRSLTFAESCACFLYQGPLRPLPRTR